MDVMTELEKNLGNALQMAAEITMDSKPGLPVDVFSLAHRLGVRSIEACDMASEGYLGIRPNGDLLIRYRSDRKLVRTRFTVAHEIGHLLLATAQGKKISSAAFRAEGESCAEEIAVNRIAAEILMPEERMYCTLSQLGVSWHSIARLCAEFEASVSAVVRRLLELRGVPALWLTIPGFVDQGLCQSDWSLRVSRDPGIMFSVRIPDLVHSLYENACISRVTDVEVYARDEKLVLPVVSRLVNGRDEPVYWCVAWSVGQIR